MRSGSATWNSWKKEKKQKTRAEQQENRATGTAAENTLSHTESRRINADIEFRYQGECWYQVDTCAMRLIVD